MGLGMINVAAFLVAVLAVASAEVFPARLMHRFSKEMDSVRVSRLGREVNGVQKWSSDYYQRLLSSDLERHKMKVDPQSEYLFPSQGGAVQLGNDFGWLHYTWIDIGSPNVSFLVALDTASDLLWVPCECMQCAPLSSGYYTNLLFDQSTQAANFKCSLVFGASIMQDKNLKEYNPSGSNTSKFINCSHQLCEQTSKCKTPDQPCPYMVNYETSDTSTSGYLVEDILHLSSGSRNKFHKSVRAPILIGCGSKQSGSYLTGVAPDGLMGLGLGKTSVPSFLAKAGFSSKSFSLCFDEEEKEGRIFFGDQGIASQNVTRFLSSGDSNKYSIEVETFCVGVSCPELTKFNVQVDSGTSFTFLPNSAYKKLVGEFDRQVNASKSSFDGYPWEYCYKSSFPIRSKIPSISLKFDSNSSFMVKNPVFVVNSLQGAVGFCLAVQPTDGDLGIIGQNFMTGYRMVFDGEHMKLGWSHSDCQDFTGEERLPLTPSTTGSPNPFPGIQEQNAPNSHPVTPAFPEKPLKSTATSIFIETGKLSVLEMFLPLWLTACMLV